MAKRKTLPKDFEEILTKGDLAEMIAVFDTCEIDARGGYSKQTALAFGACPDALSRWLVEHGASLAAEDNYGETPLHARAGCHGDRISVLLELGADPNLGGGARGTPLHSAAKAYNTEAAMILLANGARANALTGEGKTPLALALERCRNIDIKHLVKLAECLLAAMLDESKPPAGWLDRLLQKSKVVSVVTPEMQAQVTRIGKDFEFSRSRYNAESVDAVSAALERLYKLFDVEPVPRRVMPDGALPISVKSGNWVQAHQELWESLVPPSGAADTAQGECIRLSGRIHRELDENGGGNWDADFNAMADTFFEIVSSGTPLPETSLVEAQALVKAAKRKMGNTARLPALAVEWVALNPTPKPLGKIAYKR